jgi:hypothetical protein
MLAQPRRQAGLFCFKEYAFILPFKFLSFMDIGTAHASTLNPLFWNYLLSLF